VNGDWGFVYQEQPRVEVRQKGLMGAVAGLGCMSLNLPKKNIGTYSSKTSRPHVLIMTRTYLRPTKMPRSPADTRL
jgi:hypothetical protein